MQFQEKLGLLNRNFLAYLTNAIAKTPNADFTPTVRDYLKHVAELDSIYAKPSEPKKRRTDNADEAPQKKETAAKGPLSNDLPPPKKAVSFGLDEEEERKRAERVREVLAKTPKPKSSFKPEELRVSRKRSKFGAEDEAETVTFKSRAEQGNGIAEKVEAPKIPDFLAKAQTQGASFWKTKDTPPSSVGSSKAEETSKAVEPKAADDDESPKSSRPKPTFSFPSSYGTSTPENTKSSSSALFERKDTPAPFSFGVFKSNSSTSSSTTAAAPATEKPALTFGFVAKPKPAEAEAEETTEEASDEPPKVEVVVTEEPGTIFSTKCGVHSFKNKAYAKLGIGMLYLKKESEESTNETPDIFLLRAATATGAVWGNARVKNVTAKSTNEQKITVLVPNTEGVMQTLLLKLPNAEIKEKLMEHLSKK